MIYLYVLKNRNKDARNSRQSAKNRYKSLCFMRTCVSDYLGDKDIQIVKDVLGKPKIVGKKAYVSLSHSGRYLICAVSARDVGVDIEECREINYIPIMNRFFSEKERQAAKSAKDFFRTWTKKESYLKYTGSGLNAQINKVCVLSLPVFFYNIDIEDGYMCTICAAQKQQIKIVKVPI